MAALLERLFSPGLIGNLRIRNRLLMAPIGTNSCTWTGAVTDQLVPYYAERAQGGVGLINVQFTFVHTSGRTSRYTLGIYEDSLVPGLRRIAEAIHAAGGRVGIQIAHGGRRCKSAILGSRPVAPSPIPCMGGEVPRELNLSEMQRVTSWFADAARRARQAGFDAVMLHMANGYLLNEFLSPDANKRTDAYGGDTERRARLPLEVVRRVRQEVGPGYPILCRLCVDEGCDGGLTLQESQRIAPLLEAAGIDAIEAVTGVPETLHLIGPPMALKRGFRVDCARAIKEVVSIPVIASGRINDPLLAEKILQDGDADFISMGRPLLADPDLPNKAREGRLKDICSCIACNEGCNGRLYAGLDVSCVVNPRVGRETLFPSTPAKLSRRVLVAGGGPGGMMAAVTAAKRGHRVTLCEASPSLGGQLLMGCLPPHKEEIRTLVEYLVGQVMKSGVEVRLESVVSQSLIREIAPDAVILATGATPVRPSIPAADGRVVTAWDVLARRMTVGKRVLIVGGGEVGCELAELLAGLGKEVVIIEILPEVATNMEPRGRRLLLERLHVLGVQLLTQSSVSSVGERAVFYDQGGLRHRMDRVDTVVTAVGSAANNPLQQAVEGMGILVHSIGDCVKPRRILEAVREGFEAAYAI